MFCSKCGNEATREDAKFCSNCGGTFPLKKPGVSFDVRKVPLNKVKKKSVDEIENEEFIQKKTLGLIKSEAIKTEFPEKDCGKILSNIKLPLFKDLQEREIEINFTVKEFEELMELEGIEFSDGLWKKDFEGICALCSLEDTPDLVYHCLQGKSKDKFCCEIHGLLAKKIGISRIYMDFAFPEWWEKADIQTWKEDMEKSEETRKEKTLKYYKTAMMDKGYCCVCDKEIDFIEQMQGNGLCKVCGDKKDITENEKLWQKEASKYKIGSLFRVDFSGGTVISNLEPENFYKLTRKKGKRVYFVKVDDKRKVVKGEGDWFLGIPSCFKYVSQRKKTSTKDLEK